MLSQSPAVSKDYRTLRSYEPSMAKFPSPSFKDQMVDPKHVIGSQRLIRLSRAPVK